MKIRLPRADVIDTDACQCLTDTVEHRALHLIHGIYRIDNMAADIRGYPDVVDFSAPSAVTDACTTLAN